MSVPEASLVDVFKVFVDFDILESGDAFGVARLRFKLPTLSSKGRCIEPLANVDLA